MSCANLIESSWAWCLTAMVGKRCNGFGNIMILLCLKIDLFFPASDYKDISQDVSIETSMRIWNVFGLAVPQTGCELGNMIWFIYGV